MRTPSDTSSVKRRKPERPRGERRVEELLAAAADVIADVGYEAATMTAISERAGASIGTVYQYYPNKEAVVRALRTRYGEEIGERWQALMDESAGLSVSQLAEGILDTLAEYSAFRPAFVALLSAPKELRRDPALRRRMRERFAAGFRRFRPSLGQEEAFRIANVTLQIVRGLHPLQTETDPSERALVLQEFKTALKAYLAQRLG